MRERMDSISQYFLCRFESTEVPRNAREAARDHSIHEARLKNEAAPVHRTLMDSL